MAKFAQRIDEAVMLTRNHEYLAALTEFMDIYGGEEPPTRVRRLQRSDVKNPVLVIQARPRGIQASRVEEKA